MPHHDLAVDAAHMVAIVASGEDTAVWNRRALEMCEELLAEYLADEPGGEGFVHEEMAELAMAAGDEGSARPHFRRTHELLSDLSWIEPDRIERMGRLAAGLRDKT
ncbi:MAG TPA: hypothetical protein VIY70_09340 [Acidimicrobiia bacterium]